MSRPVSRVRIVIGMTTSPNTSPAASFSSPVATALIEEWARLRTSTLHMQRVRNWGIDGLAGPFGNLDEVLEILGRFGDHADDRADQLLGAVVRRAADDEFAGTLVLHRILPALVSIARRRGGTLISRQQAAFAELLPHAWIVIRTYGIERRPIRVAAGLVRDIEYQAFVRARRLMSSNERCVDQHTIEPSPAGLNGRRFGGDHPMDTVVAVISEARHRGVDEEDLRFALAWAAGADSRTLADTFGISDRTVRNRRTAVASRIRQAVGVDAA